MRTPKPLHARLVSRNIATLCARFDLCLTTFANSQGFSAPSNHFYERLLWRRGEIPFESLASDTLFLDYSYATLAIWMERQRVIEFKEFSEVLSQFVRTTGSFSNMSILNLDRE